MKSDMKSIDILFDGFPGKTSRGFLGWSSCILLRGERMGLFDTGSFADRPELVERLHARGLTPADIDYVILSHMHFDHAANVSLFTNATFYLHEEEAKHVNLSRLDDYALCAEIYDSLERTNKLQLLQGTEGMVEGHPWIHTPGHTPGCISVIVHESGANWVLAGDAVKNIYEAQTGEVWMTLNDAASKSSIQQVLSKADFIIPGHDRVIQIEHFGAQTAMKAVTDVEFQIQVSGNYPYPIHLKGSGSTESHFEEEVRGFFMGLFKD